MSKYLFLLFSLLVPVKISQLSSHRYFHQYPSQLIAMVPPPSGGAHLSMNNDIESLKEGSTITSEEITHNNGSTTKVTIITMTKKEVRNNRGEVVKVTDLSKPEFQSAKKRVKLSFSCKNDNLTKQKYNLVQYI